MKRVLFSVALLAAVAVCTASADASIVTITSNDTRLYAYDQTTVFNQVQFTDTPIPSTTVLTATSGDSSSSTTIEYSDLGRRPF